MGNVYLIPNAEGTVQQWGAFPFEIVYYDKVDEFPAPDEDTTYVWTTTNGLIMDFNHATSNLLINAVITNVRLMARCKQNTGSFPPDEIDLGIKVAGTRYPLFADTTELSTSYTNYVEDWPSNPNNGQPWKKSDIDDLQSSLRSVDSNQETRCTQIYFQVTYADHWPPTGLKSKPLCNARIGRPHGGRLIGGGAGFGG